MKKTTLILCLFSSYFFLQGCASSSVGVAASNRPLANIPYETVKSVDKTFTWYSFDIILFAMSTGNPPIDEIYTEMLAGEDADAVVNIRYWNDKSIFGPVIRHRFGIKGDLVKFSGGTPPKGKK
ncbi:LIC20211 family lipoprotein [Leptospira idonii]|uniref:Lipoprotein n=1 Tax=Leptospira idonii TaxID=1193500 RepID=A0A4R9LWP1_9LEPT|nr:hypothetical protein [Leptospira idonii]TGN17289.1 hypothetical protein EHS15_17270 [Leptospira idonii]